MSSSDYRLHVVNLVGHDVQPNPQCSPSQHSPSVFSSPKERSTSDALLFCIFLETHQSIVPVLTHSVGFRNRPSYIRHSVRETPTGGAAVHRNTSDVTG